MRRLVRGASADFIILRRPYRARIAFSSFATPFHSPPRILFPFEFYDLISYLPSTPSRSLFIFLSVSPSRYFLFLPPLLNFESSPFFHSHSFNLISFIFSWPSVSLHQFFAELIVEFFTELCRILPRNRANYLSICTLLYLKVRYYHCYYYYCCSSVR